MYIANLIPLTNHGPRVKWLIMRQSNQEATDTRHPCSVKPYYQGYEPFTNYHSFTNLYKEMQHYGITFKEDGEYILDLPGKHGIIIRFVEQVIYSIFLLDDGGEQTLGR